MRGQLLCCAAFVVAVAAGWWLGLSSDSPPEPSDILAPATVPDTPSPIPAPAEPSLPSPPPPQERYSLPPIDGVLWGRVQAPDGSGVAGVKVSAWPAVAAPSDDDLVPPLEEAIARYEKKRVWRERYRTTATTAADGSFELAGLVAADYKITNSARAKKKYPDSLVVPGSFVEFTTKQIPESGRSVQVSVDNLPKQSQTPPDIMVEPADARQLDRFHTIAEAQVTADRGVTQVQFPGPEGQLPLGKGDQVHAVAYDWYGAVMRTPAVQWDGRSREIALRFPDRNYVSIDVIYPPEMEEEVAWIGFVGIDPDGPEMSLSRFLQAAQWTNTFSGGNHFDLGFHLPVGHYRIGACLGKPMMASFRRRAQRPASTGLIVATIDAEVTGSATSVVLEIPPKDPTAGIFVTVVNHDEPFERDPFVGLTIETSEEEYQRVHSSVEKLPDGRFRLHGFGESVTDRLQGKVPGLVRVSASYSRGLGDADHVQAVVEGDQPGRATVVFHRRVPVEIVFDGLPDGFDDDVLRVYEYKYSRWYTDERPYTRKHKLPPGEYDVTYSVGPSRRNVTSMTLGKWALTIDRGDDPVVRTIEIERLYRLEILPPRRMPKRMIHIKDNKERHGAISRASLRRGCTSPQGPSRSLPRER